MEEDRGRSPGSAVSRIRGEEPDQGVEAVARQRCSMAACKTWRPEERAPEAGSLRKRGLEEVVSVREACAEDSEPAEPDPSMETVVILPAPKGYRLTAEMEETSRTTWYLWRTITQTFVRL